MCVTNTIIRRPKAISLAACRPPSNLITSQQVESVITASAVAGGSVDNRYASDVFASTASTFTSQTSQPWEKIQYQGITTLDISDDEESKPAPKRPKRRRKPQQPGSTAKGNDRHFVVHNYHDHALDDPDETDVDRYCTKRRGGVSTSFPLKLHAMLDQIEADGFGYVISWQPHGRAFVVHKPKEFVSYVMPKYFKQSKLTSFQRQLNLYGFCRLTKGQDNRGYYHELFLRGKPFLCKTMTRTKVKGTGFKAASSPDQEPDFYQMAPVAITPPTSGASDQDSSEDSDDRSMSTEATRGAPFASQAGSFDHTGSVSFVMAPMSPMSPISVRGVQQSMYQPLPASYQESALPILPNLEPQTLSGQGGQTLDIDASNIFEDDVNGTIDDFVRTWGSSAIRSLERSSESFEDAEDMFDSVEEDVLTDDYQLGCLLEQFLAE